MALPQAFSVLVQLKVVLVQSDNTTTCAYINKMGWGEMRSWPLCKKTIELWNWYQSNQVVFTLFRIRGQPQNDLYASVHNHKLVKFCSLRPRAVSKDTFALNWANFCLFTHSFQEGPIHSNTDCTKMACQTVVLYHSEHAGRDFNHSP